MLCFRDMTFCSAQCATAECPRQFNTEQQRKAVLWWKGCAGSPPVAFADFHHSCPDYVPESRI